LSSDQALKVYGVLVRDMEVDEATTTTLRRERGWHGVGAETQFRFGPARTEYERFWTDELATELAALLYTLPTGLRPFAKRELRAAIEEDELSPEPEAMRKLWQVIVTRHLPSESLRGTAGAAAP
jgi:N-methylhydantoinase B